VQFSHGIRTLRTSVGPGSVWGLDNVFGDVRRIMSVRWTMELLGLEIIEEREGFVACSGLTL